MPATAGRVRMPANNRMQTSSSLNTHGIWQNAIGYDPYAGDGEEKKKSGASAAEDSTAFQSMKGLLALAKMQHGANGTDERGGWNGRGKLRGGWAAGKDLGEVEVDKPALQPEMPSSTESDSSDESGDEGRPAGYIASGGASLGGGDKKRKREKEKKAKSEKSAS